MSTRNPHHIKRTRIGGDPETIRLFRQPPIGAVRYSRTFPTKTYAEREANAWNATGSWTAEVIPGRAPRTDRAGRPTDKTPA